MLTNNFKRKIVLLLLIFLLIISLLTAFFAVNINNVYADENNTEIIDDTQTEEKIGTVSYDVNYWKDNFNWKNMLRPKYTNCSITRISTNKYRATISVWMGYANLGIGYWELHTFVNDTEINYKGFTNNADKDHTWTIDFNHNDKLAMDIKFKVLSNYGSTTVENESKTTTFSAYNKNAPTGTLYGVENGGTTNSNVSFDWSEINCTATLNGAIYQKNTIIKGVDNKKIDYTLILTDIAGNTTTYTFTIDKTLVVSIIRDKNSNTITI